MKKLFSIVFVCITLFSFSQNSSKIILEQNLLAFGAQFYTSDGFRLDQNIFSIGSSFTLLKNNSEIATSREAILSFGKKIMVYDSSQKLIGSIEEEIFESIFSVYSVYSIYDKNHKKIATSKKIDFLGTRIDLFDSSGKLIAKIGRPAINFFGDTWNIEILNTSIDYRILIFIPCHKSLSDSSHN